MKQKHLSTIIALGVALVFIVLIGLGVCVSEALSAPDPDDQCDYMPPPEFAWEGELNPNEFDKWELLGVQRTQNPYFIYAFYKNPDESSPIQVIAVQVIAHEGTMVIYRYFKDGQPYSFELDFDNAKYVEYKFTPEERKGCMECHQDELVVQEVT